MSESLSLSLYCGRWHTHTHRVKRQRSEVKKSRPKIRFESHQVIKSIDGLSVQTTQRECISKKQRRAWQKLEQLSTSKQQVEEGLVKKTGKELPKRKIKSRRSVVK